MKELHRNHGKLICWINPTDSNLTGNGEAKSFKWPKSHIFLWPVLSSCIVSTYTDTRYAKLEEYIGSMKVLELELILVGRVVHWERLYLRGMTCQLEWLTLKRSMLKSPKRRISLPQSQTESINSQKSSNHFKLHFGCLWTKPITTDGECTSIQAIQCL